MILHLLCLLFLAAPSLAGAAEDFRPEVDDAIQRGERRIVIPPGSYHLAPRSGGELWSLHGVKDVEIIADGVVLVGMKLMRAISLHQCSGVTLRGLTVDYDPLPFLWGTTAKMISDDVVRVHREGIAKVALQGDLASLSTGQETGAPHAISIDQCERITFHNVTVHSAPGMGILEADGEGGSSFIGCSIVPGPKPSGAEEARLLSTSWDAFQSKTIRKGPLVAQCEIVDAGDDSFSVQSSDFVVLRNDGGTVVLASRDEFTDGVQLGDRLRVSVAGPEYRITSRKVVARGEAMLPAEVMEKLNSAESWSPWKVSRKCIVVTLDRTAELKPGDSIYSPDRMGNGFVFRDNRIHSPGRVLLKAGGLVEGNILDTPHGLVVCPELPGNAAAGIENLIIRRNVVRQGGWFCPAPWSSQAGIISLTATAGSSELRTDPVFKDVRIEGNIIEGGSGPHLVVSSTNGITVRDNRFVSPQHDSPPATGASYRIPKDAVVWMTKCTDISYEKNTIEDAGTFAGETVQIEK